MGDAADLREMLRCEAETFQANVDGLSLLMDEAEEEIAQLERERQALLEAQEGLTSRRASSLLDQCADIAAKFLVKWRDVAAHNAAVQEATAAGRTLLTADGKKMKIRKAPEMKLLHKLTLQAKPAPLVPPKQSVGLLGKLQGQKSGGDSEGVGQAMCRTGFALEHTPGLRFRCPIDSSEAVEVASVCFALRTIGGATQLTATDADELAAYVSMTIHNTLGAAANTAAESHLEENLAAAESETVNTILQNRETAKRIIDTMLIDVTAHALPPSSGAPTCFYCTVSIKQRPNAEFLAAVDDIVRSDGYRAHQATAEKAYCVLEALAAHSFNVMTDFGIVARRSAVAEGTAEKRGETAMRRVQDLWHTYRQLLVDEDAVKSTIQSATSGDSIPRFIDAVRPVISEVTDKVIIPCVQRSVGPSLAEPNALSQAPVAVNLYQLQMFRAPREVVKTLLHEAFDNAAAKLRESGESSRAASIKLAATKAMVSAALAIYDDLHFDIAPFPAKTANQQKRLGTLMKKTEEHASEAINFAAKSALTALKELVQEQQAVSDAVQGSAVASGLRDVSKAVAAVAKAVVALTSPPEPSSVGRALSRDSGRYDVTLCGCEVNAPLVLSIIVKPPPSMIATVEATRVSLFAAAHPAPVTSNAFTGRTAGQRCRCADFVEPLKLLMCDLSDDLCEMVSQHITPPPAS